MLGLPFKYWMALVVTAAVTAGILFAQLWWPFFASVSYCGSDRFEDGGMCMREWAMVFVPVVVALIALGAAYVAARPVWRQFDVQARNALNVELERLEGESDAIRGLDQLDRFYEKALSRGRDAWNFKEVPKEGYSERVRSILTAADFGPSGCIALAPSYVERRYTAWKQLKAELSSHLNRDHANAKLANNRKGAFKKVGTINEEWRTIDAAVSAFVDETKRHFPSPNPDDRNADLKRAQADLNAGRLPDDIVEARKTLDEALAAGVAQRLQYEELMRQYRGALDARMAKILAKVAKYESGLGI